MFIAVILYIYLFINFFGSFFVSDTSQGKSVFWESTNPRFLSVESYCFCLASLDSCFSFSLFIPHSWLEDEFGEGRRNLSIFILQNTSQINIPTQTPPDQRSTHAKMVQASLDQGSHNVVMMILKGNH